MNQKLSFDHLEALYGAWSYDARSQEAVLEVNSETLVNALSIVLAEQNRDEAGISVQGGDLDSPLLGQKFRFLVGPPRVGLGLFLPTLQDLLKNPGARIREPARYFLVDSDSVAITNEVLLYKDTLRFIKVLSESAAYLDREQALLVFIKDGRFTVPISYGVEDLRQIDRSALDELVGAFGEDLHREQKLAILGEAIVELTSGLDASKRFSTLLTSLPKLRSRFSQGYRLFASNFSYDKVKNELQEARLRYMGKIHEALTGIQSQLLAIPVATIIVATQMRQTTSVDAAFWGNVAVLLGSWVFVILVQLLIRNQSLTLSSIEQEITRQETALRKVLSDVDKTLNEVFNSLKTRATQQHAVLRTIQTLLWGGLIVAHVVFVVLTVKVQHWFLATCTGIRSFIGL